MAVDLPSVITAGVLNLIASVYVGYRAGRIREAYTERAKIAEAEAEWKKKTDRQLEELRGIIRRLEFPIRTKLGVDIKLER